MRKNTILFKRCPNIMLRSIDHSKLLSAISLDFDWIFEDCESEIIHDRQKLINTLFDDEFMKNRKLYKYKVIFLEEPIGRVADYLAKKEMNKNSPMFHPDLCEVSIKNTKLFWNVYECTVEDVLQEQNDVRDSEASFFFTDGIDLNDFYNYVNDYYQAKYNPKKDFLYEHFFYFMYCLCTRSSLVIDSRFWGDSESLTIYFVRTYIKPLKNILTKLKNKI